MAGSSHYPKQHSVQYKLLQLEIASGGMQFFTAIHSGVVGCDERGETDERVGKGGGERQSE